VCWRNRAHVDDGMSRVLDDGLGDGLDSGLDDGLDTGLDDGLDSGLDDGLDTGLDDGLDGGTHADRVGTQTLQIGSRFVERPPDVVAGFEQTVSRVGGVGRLRSVGRLGDRLDLGGKPEQLAARIDDEAPDPGSRGGDDPARLELGGSEYLGPPARDFLRLGVQRFLLPSIVFDEIWNVRLG
jgi:hypothetical protein